MQAELLIFSFGILQRGPFYTDHVQIFRDSHLVASAGEGEKSHFDHHRELFDQCYILAV